LFEIGCEEIPARMIAAAAADLRARVVAVLDAAGLVHGESRAWGGTRRLAVRVEDVAPSLPGSEQLVLGPPAAAAFGKDGTPTPAAAGFAKKQGIEPSALARIETDKGAYAGFRRMAPSRALGEVLASGLPAAVSGMSFPKAMRWGAGTHRFVRPVHWLVALHGGDLLNLSMLGAVSGRSSEGHRFLAPGPVALDHADRYVDALREARVLVDPAARRAALLAALDAAAAKAGGSVAPDVALLDEVVELVEWPGVVAGRFDPSFLALPREILVTTLRHHQKSFSVSGPDGLLPAFLSVANTDRDPAGHVRRGNEWVVVGRLEDARFFWGEDRKRSLASRVDDLARVTFHKKAGSYEAKSQRIAALARALSARLGHDRVDGETAAAAAGLAKADLVSGLVGEFPELQGIVGGLLLSAENAAPALAAAVAEHYKPAGAADSIPQTAEGCVVALADRIDTMAELVAAGEVPTGSRDPFGLRRAAGGVFRIVAERDWPLSLHDLATVAGGKPGFAEFLDDRLDNWLADRGFTPNEILAVKRPKVSPEGFATWPIPVVLARLAIVATVRGRTDFAKLVELVKRVDNILAAAATAGEDAAYHEPHDTALALKRAHDDVAPLIGAASASGDFTAVIRHMGELVQPVAKFFDDVLVLDPKNPAATRWRCQLLAGVRDTVTRDFDIRELAGQAGSNR
jgi:glycyl-tRNA synthetase beta chain